MPPPVPRTSNGGARGLQRTVDRVRQGLYWTPLASRGSLVVCPRERYRRVANGPARRQYPGRCCLQM